MGDVQIEAAGLGMPTHGAEETKGSRRRGIPPSFLVKIAKCGKIAEMPVVGPAFKRAHDPPRGPPVSLCPMAGMGETVFGLNRQRPTQCIQAEQGIRTADEIDAGD